MSQNKISTEFTFGGLLKYALPSIVMLMLISLYTIIDGMFVSRFVSTDALAAVNIVWPALTIFGAIAFMFGSGGSALIGAFLGQKKDDFANKILSLMTVVLLSINTVLAIIIYVFTEELVVILGGNEDNTAYAIEYLKVYMWFIPPMTVKYIYENLFITAGKPNLGLAMAIIGGITNVFLDYIFIVPLNMGVKGAALATGIAFCLPAIVGSFFFLTNKKGLHYSKPQAPIWTIKKICANGSSEMVTNLSGGITTLAFNILMLKYAGTDGVAAITAILYANFLMIALFLGFSVGVSPVISYHFGAKNTAYLKKLKKMCFSFIIVASIVIFIVSFLLSALIADFFAEEGTYVNELISTGMKLFSFSFIFAGINIFTSNYFTALSDGKTSALISFSRTFVFIFLGFLTLTLLFGLTGVWLAIPFAELLAIFIVIIALIHEKKHPRTLK